MKRVSIKNVSIKNFRGINNFAESFNPVRTSILGGNGVGKSTIKEAIFWCLTGKDSQDRKDFNVIPKNVADAQGDDMHYISPDVEVEFLVDDAVFTFRRVYEEVWDNVGGAPRLKNHVTKCHFCGTPLGVTEYARKVEDLFGGMEQFKLLSNPYYFASLHWQRQRELLMSLVSNFDINVIQGDPDMAELKVKYQNLDVKDIKSVCTSNKTRIKKQQEEIQTRIDQTYKTMPTESDWVAIQDKITQYDLKLESIEREKADKARAVEANGQKRVEIQQKINALMMEQTKVYSQACSAEDERVRVANEAYRIKTREIQQHESTLSMVTDEYNGYQRRIDKANESIAEYEKETDELRMKYMSIDREEFESTDVCPTCGQPMPADKIETAKAEWEKDKQERLAKIYKKASELKELVAGLKQQIAQYTEKLDAANVNKVFEQNTLEVLRKEIAEQVVERATYPMREELPKWVALEEEISKLKVDMPAENEIDYMDMDMSIRQLKMEKEALVKELALKGVIESMNEAIKRLRAELAQLADEMALNEREEKIVSNYIVNSVKACEATLNGKFKGVTFKLFTTNLSGNVEECCLVLVNGVPFPAANSSGQIKAGMSIIDTLSQHIDLVLPIIIDNAECITDIPMTVGQQILMKVTTDPTIILTF